MPTSTRRVMGLLRQSRGAAPGVLQLCSARGLGAEDGMMLSAI